MSIEVDRPVQIVSPRTGELLGLDSPTEDLAGYLADVRELEAELREAKRLVSREISARLDKAACWTMRVGGLKVTGQSPVPAEEWDGAALREALLRLMDAGVLSIEAVDAAVEVTVAYKVHKGPIAKLRKLGGDVAAAINTLAVSEEKERRITVTR